MRVQVHGPGLGKVVDLTPDLLVIQTDNGTPVALIGKMGANVAIRTADHRDFAESLRLLGLGIQAPSVETMEAPSGDRGN